MKKILVIDDEASLREMIVSVLRTSGFETFAAENGSQGVEIARRVLPDLILCDLLMPELDGFGVLEALRQEPATGVIPFVFLTGLGETQRRRSMELGADDFLTKPFSPQALRKAIEARLKKHEVVVEQAEKKLAELRDNISQALPHELRTPLQGILGFADLLSRDSISMTPEEIADIGSHIRRMAARLHHTLENILLFAHLETLGGSEENVEHLRDARTAGPGTLVKAISVEKANQWKRKDDLRIRAEAENTPVPMNENYLRKLLDEAIDNAFKFSESGSPVEIEVRDGNREIVIVVRDHGRGIDTEQLSSVGAYMQFNRKLYEQQGSGMGLTLVKRLVELHGGTFVIESEVGKGTVVTVKLPVVES